ncbi:hypothetical protein BGZ49_004473 [Haplosporangium sp. Z 27]|nr:hypothetical protein BGZ49_004473 [Haplosporangium sp. Z 27]
MALKRGSQWHPLFLLLLLCTILLQSLFEQQDYGSPLGVSAAPTSNSQLTSETNDIQDKDYLHQYNGFALEQSTPFSSQVEGNFNLDQENDTTSAPTIAPQHRFADGQDMNPRNSRAPHFNCNSDTLQLLSPAWSGTFMSNSQDGLYPSLTRNCTWTIQAAVNSTAQTGSSISPSPFPSPTYSPTISPTTSPSDSLTTLSALSTASRLETTSSPYIVALNFWSPIQLVCGVDYLTVYDGADITAPVISQICGNFPLDSMQTIYSSGPEMTVVFSTQASSPGGTGFVAAYSSVLPCSICANSSRGACAANGACVCNSQFTGSVCQSAVPIYKDFTPRSQHGMAYDSVKDMVYITGGTNSQNLYMWDMLTYTFATNKWSSINLSTRSPDPRYGHFSFMYNSYLYVYGGVTGIGAMADVWRYNGKIWEKQLVSNSGSPPADRTGTANVLATIGNATRLVVFGGINSAGETLRDINIYNMDSPSWTSISNQNSVGIAGATAVYHEATGSIYFFGGMLNQTTRNVVTYQYVIQQQSWHALAPRVDPLTNSPVQPSGNQSNDTVPSTSITEPYLPPVWYDSVSGVWSPAALMGNDLVVMYGGMLPYGPGLTVQGPSCYSRAVTVYDLSCQNWTTYNFNDQYSMMKPRVNHTMVLRPPGATGGNKVYWTAYIFGGFDGTYHQDMVNVTLEIPVAANDDVNFCRALRWCNMYDDCPNCNSIYCSYVDGLCLFDTDKAKNASIPSTAPDYLLGTTADIPKNGTIQELLLQRPDLASQVVPPQACPARIALNLQEFYISTIHPGQELIFKTYIDSFDLDIQFDIQTNDSTPLNFRSLNVWEGFMNMYWRADHGLTDDSWNGYSSTSSPTPPDLSNATTADYNPVITPLGTLNASELLDRWITYSGLDASPSSSALNMSTSSPILFLSGDPRRFSGYYVYSLNNPSSSALAFNLTVNLLDHSEQASTPSSKSNLAALGFVMAGFILGIGLLMFAAFQLRKIMRRRQELLDAEALRRMEEEEEEEERMRQENLALASRGNPKDMKPIYRVVIGVQHQEEKDGFGVSTLRHRRIAKSIAERKKSSTILASGGGGEHEVLVIPRLRLNSVGSQLESDVGSSRSRSDFINDLGSITPTTMEGSHHDHNAEMSDSCTLRSDRRHSTSTALPHSMGLKKSRSLASNISSNHSSLRRASTLSSIDRMEALYMGSDTKPSGQEHHPSATQLEGVEQQPIGGDGVGVGDYDVVDLGNLSPNGILEPKNTPNIWRRNPMRVQPISIEPLPFHGGLVPRTRKHYRRYQRLISRRQQMSGKTTPQILSQPVSRTNTVRSMRRTQLQGSLKRAKTTATIMALGSSVGSISEQPLTNDEHWECIEMDDFEVVTPVSQQPESPQNSKPPRSRKTKEYEPGPLLAVNVLIVFPGDAKSRPFDGVANNTGSDNSGGDSLESRRLPPMAIGSTFVPDPVRWWAYKARQLQDRRRFERGMMSRQNQEQYPRKSL